MGLFFEEGFKWADPALATTRVRMHMTADDYDMVLCDSTLGSEIRFPVPFVG